MRGSGNNRGGSSNRGGGSGGGRGGLVSRPKKKVTAEEPERDTSPAKETTPEKASDVVKTPDTTTPTKVWKEKEKGDTPPVKQNTAPLDTRPRSKGDQRRDTQKKPLQPKKNAQAVWARKPERVRPKIGDPSEKVTPEHINWVRDQFNRANLKTVWEGLAAESPRRGDLMKAVVRQAIRAGIYEVMSTGMKSMANIHADGTPLAFTEARGVRDDKDLDVELTEGSERDVAVWNASRGDAEVEAIRDVLAWARSIDPSTLSGKEKVVLQIVGNSGSCEACQKRLTAMADRIQSEWRLRAPNADLPRLDIWCYYSNDTDKRFKRGGYDTYNGWSDDVASPDLSLTGQGDRAWFVEVYEHQLLTYGPAPKRPEIADTSPESTITPVTIIPSTQTDSSKPSKEEDIS